MGFGGISIWQLVIILVIVLLLFGTKKLRNIGSDLGGAVKGFKDSMSDADKKSGADADADENRVIEGETLNETSSEKDTEKTS